MSKILHGRRLALGLHAMTPGIPAARTATARHGIARVLSKLGLGSRTQAAQWVRDGRVRVNGRIVRDPEFRVQSGNDVVLMDGRTPTPPARTVIMLNKPRGLVTTARDEKGRDTVYNCLAGADLPWLAPVGRLDKASEGLLLLSNDPAWAARITAPTAAITKTYHVQIDRTSDDALLADIRRGVTRGAEHLAAKTVHCLRSGAKNAWLQIVLEEGRNRHLRRLLAALDVSVLRLVRVGVGTLLLGDLAKGCWRHLTNAEIRQLGGAPSSRSSGA